MMAIGGVTTTSLDLGFALVEGTRSTLSRGEPVCQEGGRISSSMA